MNGGMSIQEIPTFTLNDSSEMPAIGLGTWKLRGDEVIPAIRSAIELGYRQFDTASLYQNEVEVGQALAQAIAAGDVTREELRVTSKVWNDQQGEEQVQQSFQRSLQNLGLDYLDCFMVHWPCPRQGTYVESFAALAKIQGLGQLQSVAVANFYPEVLDEIIQETGVVPAINQVELHPGFSQPELRAYHERHGILTQAWAPLARGEVFEAEPIHQAAQALDRTPAQVILRWLHQLGASVIPKSVKLERQRENLSIFDFQLSEEQMQAITALDAQGGRLYPDPRVFPEEQN